MNFLFTALSIVFASVVFAQTDTTKFIIKTNADIASRYIWRGSDYFNSPCIQPDFQLVYKETVGIGAWGAFSTTNQPIQETDLYLFANIQRFSFYLYDYFYPNYTTNHQYFNYSPNKTGHTLSIDASYTLSEKFPITVLASYNFWGNDTLKSSYFEISYEHPKKHFKLFVGGTPGNGWYAPKAGICNTGIEAQRTIEVTEKFSVPLKLQFVVNPIKENVYFAAIISL